MNWADSHVEEGGSLVMDWDRLHGAFLSEASENEKVSIDSAPTGQNKGVRSEWHLISCLTGKALLLRFSFAPRNFHSWGIQKNFNFFGKHFY